MPGNRRGQERYVSASELAEYAFCPRAHYYRLHPEGRRLAAGALDRSRSGTAYHRSATTFDRRWSGASVLPWALALLAGAVLLVVALAGGVP